jgi:hypothetical protein
MRIKELVRQSPQLAFFAWMAISLPGIDLDRPDLPRHRPGMLDRPLVCKERRFAPGVPAACLCRASLLSSAFRESGVSFRTIASCPFIKI